MAFDLTRRRFVKSINSKYIYGVFPLINAIVILIELIAMSRLIAKFNGYYNSRPILTMMISNAILGGIADTTAQTITSVRQRAVRKPGGPSQDDTLAIEIHELDRKNPLNEQNIIPDSRLLPPPFDFERLTRFMGYGFIMAPVQFKWFQFLSKTFPVTPKSGMLQVCKSVAMDQLVFAPIGIAIFFTAMTVAEGGGKRAVENKLRDMYVPTLKANYLVWPAVQLINFRLMPLQFQLPFVSSVGIAWTAYLSLSNAAGDVEETREAID